MSLWRGYRCLSLFSSRRRKEGPYNHHEGIRHLRVCTSIQSPSHPRRARACPETRLGRAADRRALCRAQLFRRALFPFPSPPSPVGSLQRAIHLTLYETDIAVSGKISNTASASVRSGRRICRNRCCCTGREPVQEGRPCVWECSGCLRRARRRETRGCVATARCAFIRSGCRCVDKEHGTCGCLFENTYRALRDIPDELRSTRGTRETTSRCVRADRTGFRIVVLTLGRRMAPRFGRRGGSRNIRRSNRQRCDDPSFWTPPSPPSPGQS
jgi:hypothetical protein